MDSDNYEQTTLPRSGYLTKDMVMEGSHFVDVAGKLLLCFSKLNMLFFVVLGDGIEAAGQFFNLFRQLHNNM